MFHSIGYGPGGQEPIQNNLRPDLVLPCRSAVAGATLARVIIGGLLLDGNIDGVSTGVPSTIRFAGISGSGVVPIRETTEKHRKGGGDGREEPGETTLTTGLSAGKGTGGTLLTTGFAAN
ncbi:hypothetical protein SDJN03_12224, partial [Cucurbita argyrosperma subsp. sororia]